MKVRIAARIFIAGQLIGEEGPLDLDADALERELPLIAERHAALAGDRPFMVEIEFLDEPDANARYFRFGTDPSGMVIPIAISIGGQSRVN